MSNVSDVHGHCCRARVHARVRVHDRRRHAKTPPRPCVHSAHRVPTSQAAEQGGFRNEK